MNYVQGLSKELEETKNNKEPAVQIGTILSAAATVAVVIAQFFPQLDSKLVNVISIVLVIALPIVTSVLIRNKVWSPATVELFTLIKADEAAKVERLKNVQPFRKIPLEPDLEPRPIKHTVENSSLLSEEEWRAKYGKSEDSWVHSHARNSDCTVDCPRFGK